jgi:ABC-2 type transport system ATP-binding protein
MTSSSGERRPGKPPRSKPRRAGRARSGELLPPPRAARPPQAGGAGSAVAQEAPPQEKALEPTAAEMGDAVIFARGLTKRYGDFTAVDRLDLAIRPGEVFGLLGPNGAGKTTTVLMLLGLSEPTEGFARVVGLDPAREPLLVKRRVGYLPDSVGFYGGMTGRENMRYTARLNGLDRSAGDARIEQLLADVRLSDAADRKVETYSRGMRQRLGIADALVKDPSVLILDEPTIAIDPAGVEEILGLLRRLVAEHNLTIMLSSHILGQVQSICDRVGFFSAGKIVAQGRLEELRKLAGGGAIAFEVGADGDPDAIEGVLRRVPGVTDVTREPGDRPRWIVHSHRDVAAALTAALSAAGHSIDHLRRRGEDLLEIYRNLVPEERDGRLN